MLGRISDIFVVKGDTTENCLSSQRSKKSSVQPAPQTGASLQKKPRAHVRANNTLREITSLSLARFTSRCTVPPASDVLRISTGAQNTGHHQLVVWHVSQVARARETVLPRNLQVPFLLENKRLPCVIRARSAWRCATPCCLPAFLFSEECLYRESSEDLPERPVAVVQWLWAEPVRTCALPRFDRVLRGRGAVSPETRCSARFS